MTTDKQRDKQQAERDALTCVSEANVRQAFESGFLIRNPECGQRQLKMDGERYVFTTVQAEWIGYQAALASQAARIEELETICAEAYQVVGHFSDMLPDAKILDNLSQQKLVHADVLPFKPVQSPEVQKLVELCEELLSVETSNTLGNLWEKTHLIEASSGEPVYSAELTRAQLIEYRNRLKALQPFTQKEG